MKKTIVCLARPEPAGSRRPGVCRHRRHRQRAGGDPAAPVFRRRLANDAMAPGAVNTLFSINNASATAVLAHVTLWTDESVPTLDFDIYLTGYDIQTISMCDIFHGVVPVTASAGQDPNDTISPKGPVSQDINFAELQRRASVLAPCRQPLPQHIQAAHTGKFSPSSVAAPAATTATTSPAATSPWTRSTPATSCSPAARLLHLAWRRSRTSCGATTSTPTRPTTSPSGESLVAIEACNTRGRLQRGGRRAAVFVRARRLHLLRPLRRRRGDRPARAAGHHLGHPLRQRRTVLRWHQPVRVARLEDHHRG